MLLYFLCFTAAYSFSYFPTFKAFDAYLAVPSISCLIYREVSRAVYLSSQVSASVLLVALGTNTSSVTIVYL